MTKATHNDRGWSLCLNRYVLASKAMRLPTNFRLSIYLSKVFPSPCPFRTSIEAELSESADFPLKRYWIRINLPYQILEVQQREV